MNAEAHAADATKAELRATVGRARRALDDTAREWARTAVREVVLARCRDEAWTCVAGYVPLRSEPGSTALLDGLVALGARVIVPVTLADRDLDWTPWPADDAAPRLGRFAIADADAVLVPALAVALDGTRLGRGGGSYDRALPRRRAGVQAAALLFAGETYDHLPRDPWDVAVSALVDPDGWRVLDAGDRSGPEYR